MKALGLITIIQPMSIHDGPGIRTTIFFKGCNMRCKWCHNPETWSSVEQIEYIDSKCIHCLLCKNTCPHSAIEFLPENNYKLNRTTCDNCSKCVEICPTGALNMIGKKVTPKGLFEEVRTDLPFWVKSNGGITISGGEPFLQPIFLKSFLELCHNENISTAVETNLLHDWSLLRDFLPLVDYWFCDFKIADSDKHKYWTGVRNDKIIENIHLLADSASYIKVRTPIIPGVNDQRDDVLSICRELSPYSDKLKYELLGFHTLGFEKYKLLDIENEMISKTFIDKNKLEELKKIPLDFNLLP